jgi:hypothetical protein
MEKMESRVNLKFHGKENQGKRTIKNGKNLRIKKKTN